MKFKSRETYMAKQQSEFTDITYSVRNCQCSFRDFMLQWTLGKGVFCASEPWIGGGSFFVFAIQSHGQGRVF